MRNEVVVKVLVLFVLVFLSLIPLGMIWRVVADRARYRDRVVEQVAQTSARAQVLAGPVLVMEWPVRRQIASTTAGARDSIDQMEEQLVFPDSLGIQSTVRVETRQRGIYRVPVYRAGNRLRATFTIPERLVSNVGFIASGPPRARLVFGVSDSRGLRVTPTVSLDGTALPVASENRLSWTAQGFSTPFDVAGKTSATVEANIELTGTDRLGLVPIGANTDVTMDSNWPHPGFTGGFSPDEREITSSGFRARWRLSRMATGDPLALVTGPTATRRQEAESNDMGVRFVQPVDIYQQSERAAKYGVLFVALTFVAFFLFETLRQMRIHPIQYSLVAAGLAIFFLLLVSLSEHLPFAVAYAVAAAACVSLIAFYAGHVLGAMTRGLGFGGMLVLLYVLLFVILQSEDYALLLGALLLFGALAAVMVITRRVDWYRLNETPAPKT